MSFTQTVKALTRRRVALAAIAMPLLPLVAIALPLDDPNAVVASVAAAAVLFGSLATMELRRGLESAREVAIAPVVRGVPAEPVAASDEPGPLTGRKLRLLRRWRARLNYGWSTTAAEALLQRANSKREHPEYRLKALAALSEFHSARRGVHRPARTLEVDIVIVSTMNLLGGTTSANEAEILAYREAGLRVGIFHHPVIDRALDRPMHQRLRDLVDDEQIFELHAEDTVHCDLAIVRFPVALTSLIDERPEIIAARTVLLVNQTPYEEYGLTGGYGTPWSIRDVHRNVTTWLGPHTWYAIGPAVRDVLKDYHADEVADIDLAADFWYETIDVVKWTPEVRRVRGEGDPIRIGRHSRDNITKFPNMARQLRAAYPDAEDIEVHVLGGEKALLKLLGAIPPRWTSHRFGTMSPVEFLGTIDVYAYFIDPNYIEAFGRSPLEAMAAGVPCILPWSFAELFGDGALYCEPHEVEALVRELVADPVRYRERVESGLRIVDERFSPRALVHRVGELGAKADPARAHRHAPHATMTLEDAR